MWAYRRVPNQNRYLIFVYLFTSRDDICTICHTNLVFVIFFIKFSQARIYQFENFKMDEWRCNVSIPIRLFIWLFLHTQTMMTMVDLDSRSWFDWIAIIVPDGVLDVSDVFDCNHIPVISKHFSIKFKLFWRAKKNREMSLKFEWSVFWPQPTKMNRRMWR